MWYLLYKTSYIIHLEVHLSKENLNGRVEQILEGYYDDPRPVTINLSNNDFSVYEGEKMIAIGEYWGGDGSDISEKINSFIQMLK